MSANLPNGTRNIAAARTAEVAIQLRDNASIENSLPMEGRAILTEDPIRGVRKAADADAASAALLSSSEIIMEPASLTVNRGRCAEGERDRTLGPEAPISIPSTYEFIAGALERIRQCFRTDVLRTA